MVRNWKYYNKAVWNLGIAFVHQELNLFNDLKVYENIFLQKEYTTKFGCLDKKKNDSGGRETVPGTGSGYWSYAAGF